MFVTIEEFECFETVHYYTVRFEDYDESETDYFLKSLSENSSYKEEIDVLLRLIEAIGNKGAKQHYFRFENYAEALPPSSKFVETLIDEKLNLSIRLYCMRITDSIVILFNGGFKTTQSAQECPNVSRHFQMANRMSSIIQKMLVEKELLSDEQILRGEIEFEI